MEDSRISWLQTLDDQRIDCSHILGTREKSFCKTWFQVGMELKKVQKQGRDERTQEEYRTSAKISTRCRVVFLRSFISALFLYLFSAPSLLEIKFYRNFFP